MIAKFALLLRDTEMAKKSGLAIAFLFAVSVVGPTSGVSTPDKDQKNRLST
jgi:hypothetical protein